MVASINRILLNAKPKIPTNQSSHSTHNQGTLLDLKQIKQIIELMKRNDLTHFELEREGEKIVLKKNVDSDALAAIPERHLRLRFDVGDEGGHDG